MPGADPLSTDRRALFPEFGLVASAARIEPQILPALPADVPDQVEKHPDHEGNGRQGRKKQKQSQVKIDRHVSPRPSVSPPILTRSWTTWKGDETGHLQENAIGISREQSESKGFIN